MSTSALADTDQKTIDILKAVIMDTVRNANSGHTGGPLSSLDFTYVLFNDFLSFDPDDPSWFNRDRFVMSIGHESALLYSMLTLVGWLEVDDLKSFRQLGSLTPGHPERGLTPGVEATTGPLGQGVGNAVGMAVSESILNKLFGNDIVDHYTYVLHGDGDIQEPIAQGAIALAGHWKLNKLIAYYDSNNAQISGKVSRSDSTDYALMYKSDGWSVIEVDGHNKDEIRSAIRKAQMEVERPTVIIGHTKMANGCATMEGDHNTHGAPLPPEEIASTKKKLGLDPDSFFYLPEEVIEEFQSSYDFTRNEVKAWKNNLSSRCQDKEFKDNWELAMSGNISSSVNFPKYKSGETVATRKVWGAVIEAMAPFMPTLVGGSADLEPSNVTSGFAEMVKDFGPNMRGGRNFAYGVREFPMGAINNGIAQHGGMKVFGATFFVFSDYERPALRLRALQNLDAVSEYTHDSIYVGEDGPTHQPVEHLMACRSIPNLLVLRPADANEAVEAIKISFSIKRPSLVLLSRQGLPVIDREEYASYDLVEKGGYILSNVDSPDLIIYSSGSEVHLALDAKKALGSYKVRVVNMFSWELFNEQSEDYKNTILSQDFEGLRVSIEAGVTMGWERFTGLKGLNIGINSFGESAPGKEVANHFGLNSEEVVKKIVEKLGQST